MENTDISWKDYYYPGIFDPLLRSEQAEVHFSILDTLQEELGYDICEAIGIWRAMILFVKVEGRAGTPEEVADITAFGLESIKERKEQII